MRKTNPISFPGADGGHSPPYQERRPPRPGIVQSEPNLVPAADVPEAKCAKRTQFPCRGRWWAMPTLPGERGRWSGKGDILNFFRKKDLQHLPPYAKLLCVIE
jgi:hypothetical protein